LNAVVNAGIKPLLTTHAGIVIARNANTSQEKNGLQKEKKNYFQSPIII
jgi:hypothetical protein